MNFFDCPKDTENKLKAVVYKTDNILIDESQAIETSSIAKMFMEGMNCPVCLHVTQLPSNQCDKCSKVICVACTRS